MLELKLKEGSLEQICKDAQNILNEVLSNQYSKNQKNIAICQAIGIFYTISRMVASEDTDRENSEEEHGHFII